jgi:hypothetical protein
MYGVRASAVAIKPAPTDVRPRDAMRRACRRSNKENVSMIAVLASVLQDPAWVAVIVAVVALPVGIAVPFLLARAQTGRKALGYGVTAASLVRDTARGRLTIFFADREVSSVALITVTLVNVGSQPIRREDYDGPLRIRYGHDAEVLDADLVAAEPSGLSPEVTLPAQANENGDAARGCVEIAPLLLNSHDSITVEAVVDRHNGSASSVTVEGRIAGIAELERFDEDLVSTGALVAVAVREAATMTALSVIPGARLVSVLGSIIGSFGGTRSRH